MRACSILRRRFVDQQRGEFDPSKFVDRYEHALREVIDRKRQGQPQAVAADEAPDSKVIDLMDALKRSLGQSGEATLQKRPRAASRNKPSPKPAGRRRRVA
jgi:DNA end-binding protein Ku